MVRYYRRRYRPYTKKDRWNVETKSIAMQITKSAERSAPLQIIPTTTVEGWRTVKNITVTCSVPVDFRWVLVYVPQGTKVGELNQSPISSVTEGVGTSIVSIYEPNQYVMAAGTFDGAAGPNRIFCPLARKLSSGDSIYLVIRGADNTSLTTIAIVRYAIKYN